MRKRWNAPPIWVSPFSCPTSLAIYARISRTGRCYLPLDWMEEFGVTRETLFDPKSEFALTSIVKRLVDSVQVYEDSARLGVDKLPFRSRLAVLSALRIYGAIGRRVGKLGSAAWDERVTVGKMQKLAYVVPSFAEAVAGHR